MKTEPIRPGQEGVAEEERLGRVPTAEELYWLEREYKNPVESIGRIEETAKFLVTVVTGVSGLFAAAWKLAEGEKAQGEGLWWLPFVLWVFSMISLVIVFFPGFYSVKKQVPESVKAAYRAVLWWKFWWLAAGLIFFLLGVLSTVLPMGMG